MSDSGGSHKKLSNGLLALSSAAVLAVYTAGYLRTKSAADRFAVQAATRRPVVPAPATTAASVSLPAPAPVPVAAASGAEAPELPAVVVEQTAPPPVPEAPKPEKPQYKDGTYLGWGTSRHLHGLV